MLLILAEDLGKSPLPLYPLFAEQTETCPIDS